MKTFIHKLILLSVFSLFGCTKVIYTQQQVLERYKTKQDVTNRFGSPTEKLSGDTTETWLYNYVGRNSVTGYSNTNTKVNDFGRYNKYVTFLFDRQGNVIRSESTGMDLSERESAPGKTIGLILGSLGLLAIIGAIAASSMTYHFAW